MDRKEYQIVDDFQVKDFRVLVLDRDYEYGGFEKVIIDGQTYSYALNSVGNWVTIKSTDNFKDKKAMFI